MRIMFYRSIMPDGIHQVVSINIRGWSRGVREDRERAQLR